MANCLKVRLVPKINPTTVQVDDGGDTENRVKADDTKKEPQIIKWHLVDDAEQGRFVSLSWLSTGPSGLPKPGIFGPLTEIAGTPWATVSDLHTGRDSAGDYHYQLTIQVGGNYYQTPLPGAMAGPNPNIKNT
jgi:hypothetical protein